ncbi:hypothetical protein KAI58_00820 [Candidatus Gracilibacteria bacterium]|nr:hypothetical protein [Candidatus Gracilibacteria bacterium]
MANQQLIDWIKVQKAQGHSDKELYDILIKKGFKHEQLNEVLTLPNPVVPVTHSAQVSSEVQSVVVQETTISLTKILVGISSIFLVGGGIFWFVFNQGEPSIPEETEVEVIEEIMEPNEQIEENEELEEEVVELNKQIEENKEVVKDHKEETSISNEIDENDFKGEEEVDTIKTENDKSVLLNSKTWDLIKQLKVVVNQEPINLENLNNFSYIEQLKYPTEKECTLLFPDKSVEECQKSMIEFGSGKDTINKLDEEKIKIYEDERQGIVFQNGNENQIKIFTILNDGDEWKILNIVFVESDIIKKDSDNDGRNDEDEDCSGDIYNHFPEKCIKSNLNEKDSDNDGWWDGTEIKAKTDPNDLNSKPLNIKDILIQIIPSTPLNITTNNTKIKRPTVKRIQAKHYQIENETVFYLKDGQKIEVKGADAKTFEEAPQLIENQLALGTDGVNFYCGEKICPKNTNNHYGSGYKFVFSPDVETDLKKIILKVLYFESYDNDFRKMVVEKLVDISIDIIKADVYEEKRMGDHVKWLNKELNIDIDTTYLFTEDLKVLFETPVEEREHCFSGMLNEEDDYFINKGTMCENDNEEERENKTQMLSILSSSSMELSVAAASREKDKYKYNNAELQNVLAGISINFNKDCYIYAYNDEKFVLIAKVGDQSGVYDRKYNKEMKQEIEDLKLDICNIQKMKEYLQPKGYTDAFKIEALEE